VSEINSVEDDCNHWKELGVLEASQTFKQQSLLNTRRVCFEEQWGNVMKMYERTLGLHC
jgi:hypothetical protein